MVSNVVLFGQEFGEAFKQFAISVALAFTGANFGEILEKLRKIYPVKIGSLSNPLDLPWISSSQTYLDIAKVAIKENIDVVLLLTDAWEEFEGEHFNNYYNNLLKIKELTESLNKVFILILPEYPARRRRKY